MITRVEIKNYPSIAHADVQMGPLTVLVGRKALQIGLENAVEQLLAAIETGERTVTPHN